MLSYRFIFQIHFNLLPIKSHLSSRLFFTFFLKKLFGVGSFLAQASLKLIVNWDWLLAPGPLAPSSRCGIPGVYTCSSGHVCKHAHQVMCAHMLIRSCVYHFFLTYDCIEITHLGLYVIHYYSVVFISPEGILQSRRKTEQYDNNLRFKNNCQPRKNTNVLTTKKQFW